MRSELEARFAEGYLSAFAALWPQALRGYPSSSTHACRESKEIHNLFTFSASLDERQRIRKCFGVHKRTDPLSDKLTVRQARSVLLRRGTKWSLCQSAKFYKLYGAHAHRCMKAELMIVTAIQRLDARKRVSRPIFKDWREYVYYTPESIVFVRDLTEFAVRWAWIRNYFRVQDWLEQTFERAREYRKRHSLHGWKVAVPRTDHLFLVLPKALKLAASGRGLALENPAGIPYKWEQW
jgi:hypothetical protein